MDNWLQWATSETEGGLGHDLQMHDIKFVSGTLKTTKWACAAFSGSYRNKKGSVKVNAAAVGELDLNVSIENYAIPGEFYNNGPIKPADSDVASRPSISDEGHLLPANEDTQRASTSSPLPAKRDQCIFFHYFAMKKRFFGFPHKIEAAAGPHQLPPADPEMEGNSPLLAAAEDVSEYDIRELPSVDATVRRGLPTRLFILTTKTGGWKIRSSCCTSRLHVGCTSSSSRVCILVA